MGEQPGPGATVSCSPGRNEGKAMPGRGTGGAKAGSQEGESSWAALTAEERARGGGRGAEGKKARLEREVGPGLPEASRVGVLGGVCRRLDHRRGVFLFL